LAKSPSDAIRCDFLKKSRANFFPILTGSIENIGNSAALSEVLGKS
jgi:hypothetical protein